MVLKTLKVAVLSFLFFLGILLLIEPRSYLEQNGLTYLNFFLVGFFYGFPVLVIGTVTLFIINRVTFTFLNAKAGRSANKWYFIFGILISLLTVLGFTIFDYLDRGRFLQPTTFLSIFNQYSPTLIFAAVALILNRKIVWDNFRKYRPY